MGKKFQLKIELRIEDAPLFSNIHNNIAAYSQHLSLQKSPVLHAAGGVHVEQLALDGRRVP